MKQIIESKEIVNVLQLLTPSAARQRPQMFLAPPCQAVGVNTDSTSSTILAGSALPVIPVLTQASALGAESGKLLEGQHVALPADAASLVLPPMLCDGCHFSRQTGAGKHGSARDIDVDMKVTRIRLAQDSSSVSVSVALVSLSSPSVSLSSSLSISCTFLTFRLGGCC